MQALTSRIMCLEIMSPWSLEIKMYTASLAETTPQAADEESHSSISLVEDTNVTTGIIAYCFLPPELDIGANDVQLLSRCGAMGAVIQSHLQGRLHPISA